MKVCLYLEFYHFWGGILFKNIGTGLLSSYRNQKKILDHAGIPYVEHWDSSCDILQINTPWLKSRYLMRKARKRGMKIIVFSHVTVEDAMQVFWFMPLVAPLFRWYLKRAYDAADAICAPTAYTKSLLVAYGIRGEKIFVLSNGVDLNQFYKDVARREAFRRGQNLEGLVVGTVGLVIPRKGIDIFLKLAETFPRTPFLWVGKIYNPLLVKPLPKMLPGNARFTGYVPDVLAAFNAFDIFIFPSYEENQGIVILEAAAVGVPILVRDIPAYRGWLVDGENCLKAKNDGEFAACLKRLLADGVLRSALSENARALAGRESIASVAANLEALYERLLRLPAAAGNPVSSGAAK